MISLKKLGLYALAVIAIFGAGFATSRYTTPVEYKEKETKTVLDRGTTIINQQIDIDELMKRVEDKIRKNNIKKTKEIIKTPDGTVTERETETDLSETSTHTATESEKKSSIDIKLLDDKLHIDQQTLEKSIKRNSSHPEWSFLVQSGYLLPVLFGKDPGFNLVPHYKGLFVGASVERYLFNVPFVGPLWFGAFGNSAGAAGLQLRLEH